MTINHTMQDQLAAIKGKVKVHNPQTVEVRRPKTWRKRDEELTSSYIDWDTQYVKPHWECLTKSEKAHYFALFN